MEKELISPDSGLHRVTHCIKWGNLHRKKGLFGPKIDQETFLKETPEEKAREGGYFFWRERKTRSFYRTSSFLAQTSRLKSILTQDSWVVLSKKKVNFLSSRFRVRMLPVCRIWISAKCIPTKSAEDARMARAIITYLLNYFRLVKSA